MLKLSVVIPVWNEEQRISSTIEEILRYLACKADLESAEIIIVDDGSTDRTREIIASFHEPRIRIIGDSGHHGKGWAVRTGLAESRGELILFMDADSSTPIDELDVLLLQTANTDIVIGSRALAQSRILKAQSGWKVLFGRFGNVLIQWLLLPGLHDTQCGFKLYSHTIKKFVPLLTIDGWGFDFELLFVARKAGMSIGEVPVRWKNDTRSKVRLFSYLVTLNDLLRVRINNIRGVYTLNT